MSWSKVTIGSLGKVVTGKTPSTEHDEYYGGSIPFITPKDMVGIRSVETERFLTDSGMESVASSVVPENTICVSCIGSDMGKVVITQQMSVTNQQINSIIVSSNYDYQFVYYLLYSMKDKIQSLGKNSTAIPILNKAKFSALDVVVPDLPTQNRIASILSTYDDLIENNRRQIKLLEEAAQRLYREWFVELRFPGHENVKIVDGVPEGWKKVKLQEICPVKTGKKDANFGTTDGKYPFFTCAQAPIQAPSYSFDCSAVILAGNGDFNVKIYRGQFEAYQRTYVLSPLDLEHLFLLFNSVRMNMDVLTKGASGSTIKFLTKGMIDSIELLIPPALLLDQYNKISESIQSKVELLKRKIDLSTEVRDMLLPKLMSGEMEVSS